MTNKEYSCKNKIHILNLDTPMMKAWPEDCFLSSLILKKDTAFDWIINSFVQICSYKQQNNNMRVNFLPSGKHHYEINAFDYCPFVYKNSIENDIILDAFGSFTAFAIYFISNGYYVSTFLDQFFRGKKYECFYHPVYIFGYDLEKKVLHTADSYYSGKYGYKEVTIDDIDMAFGRINKNSLMGYHHFSYMYKLKDFHHDFDIDLLNNLLTDYLESNYKKSFTTYEYNNMFYGIDCYNALIEYIKKIITSREKYIDLRSFVFLIDYKMITKMRIDYLIEKKYILLEIELLKDKIIDDISKSRTMLNLGLKYQLKPDIKYLQKILEIMEKLYSEEYKFVERLIKALK